MLVFLILSSWIWQFAPAPTILFTESGAAHQAHIKLPNNVTEPAVHLDTDIRGKANAATAANPRNNIAGRWAM